MPPQQDTHDQPVVLHNAPALNDRVLLYPQLLYEQEYNAQDPQSRPSSLIQTLPPLDAQCSRLYLCRHGQTDFNRLHMFQGRGVDTMLNETGILQANYLAYAMRNVPLRAIYSSTLRRAKETAMIVAQYHPKVDLRHHHELEEMSFGVFEGNPHAVYETQLRQIHHEWELGNFKAAFPSGECPCDVVERGAAKIHALMQASQDQDHVLIVTHGRFNKIVLSHMLDGHLDKMQSMVQSNTCVNVVDYDHMTQQYKRVELNNVQHLPAMLRL